MNLIKTEVPQLSDPERQFQGIKIISIRASHQEGEFYPTFMVDIKPYRGTELSSSTHFAWTPPEEMIFTIGNASWTCRPGDTPRRISGNEVVYQVKYIPTPFYTLRYGSYGKNVVWLSCPTWMYDQYTASYNEDEYKIFHKESDVYPSNGFTVNEILEDLGELIEVSITAALSKIHVTQPTIMLRSDTPFVSFINSLLPNGFPYVWDSQSDALTVAMAEPSTEDLSIPPGAYNLDYTSDAVVQYDSVEILGGQYKLGHGMTLGDNPGFRSATSTRASQIVIDALPAETKILNGKEQTTQVTRKTQTDLDGNPFAVLQEIQEISGPINDKSGDFVQDGLIKKAVIDYEYENVDPMVYSEPRLIKTTTTSSGYITKFFSGPARRESSSGILYYLTKALDVITYAEFIAMEIADRPDILMSAYVGWRDDDEIIEEDKAYVKPAAVTQDWPEGYEKSDSKNVRRFAFYLASAWYDGASEGKATLEKIAHVLRNEDSPTEASIVSITSTIVPPEMRQPEIIDKKVKLNSPGSYSFEETRTTYSQDSDKLMNDSNTTAINSTPPSAPTKYRTEPLRAFLRTVPDDPLFGQNDRDRVFFGTTGTIPTCNPQDFERWAGMLFWQMTHTKKMLTCSVRNYILPQGYRVGAGTVIAWEASQQGAESSAEMVIM